MDYHFNFHHKLLSIYFQYLYLAKSAVVHNSRLAEKLVCRGKLPAICCFAGSYSRYCLGRKRLGIAVVKLN